jgi:hypothetical protein
MAEAQLVLVGGLQAHQAPISALQLYHQTAHLLGVCTDPAGRRLSPEHDRQAERTRQMELPLPARVA